MDEAAKTEAQQSSIQPVPFTEQSRGEPSIKLGWVGARLTYADSQEVIPFIGTVDGLEYRVLSSIHRMTKKERSTIGFHFRHEEEGTHAELQSFRIQLAALHRTTEVVEDGDGNLDLSGIDVLVVPAPTLWTPPAVRRQIDEYLADGGSALFLIDPVGLVREQNRLLANQFSLADYLEAYGARARYDVVFDMRSNELLDFGPVEINYPYWPRVNAAESRISGGVTSAVLPYPSSIDTIPPTDGSVDVEVRPLLQTTRFGGLDEEFIDVSPQSPALAQATEEFLSERVVAAAITGSRCPPQEPDCQRDHSERFRIIVATDSGWLTDVMLRRYRENLAMGVNWMDWLAQDDALAAVRAKGISRREAVFTSDAHRSVVQWGNTVGGILLFTLLGVVRYIFRRNAILKAYTRES